MLTHEAKASVLSMPSGMWYGDRKFELDCPSHWDVTVFWPETPREMTSAEIAGTLERPTGQPPLRDMCRGAKRPLVIVDDVNRPTPAGVILTPVLRHLADASIAAKDVTIVLATGAHAAPRMESVQSKVGEAAKKCRVLVHNAHRDVVSRGRTRFGTPVLLNKEVAAADFVIGIGGVYPNSTAGYGGGSKLALGVLGFESILALHYLHGGAGWGRSREQDTFREDLNEIAQMAGLRSLMCAHLNAAGKIVRLRCGDYLSYYEEERAFANRSFSVPAPTDANVVISNAYPNDLSLTFALMKGAAPLHVCRPDSSRILLARCSEGVGGHSLFPVVNSGRVHAAKMYLRFAGVRPVPFAQKALSVIARKLRMRAAPSIRAERPSWKNPVRLYTGEGGDLSCGNVSGVEIASSWAEILAAVDSEQPRGGRALKVAVYSCAPLLSFVQPQEARGF